MNERIQEQDAMERALSELVDKICPGLDTGDLLADAATASKSIDIPPAAQPAPVQDEQQAFIDSLPKDSDDKMLTQIDHWARESYKRHKFSVRGQTLTAADSYDSHLIWATLRWAKENTQPAAQPVKEMQIGCVQHDCDECKARLAHRPWVGLTDEERNEIQLLKWWDWEDTFDLDGFTRAIEAKLKEKNT